MSGEDSSSHTRQEIGRTLERARRERGLSLEDVEQATKIRVRYLRDLENENFDVLPAVYMLGSLKTYARHLGLDEEALTREFKHRQALLQERQNPSQKEPQASESRGILASLGRLLGVGRLEAGEDDAGTVPDPGHSPRLYPSLGVVLIFVLATAVASNLRLDEQPKVSQVSQPKTSQFPTMLVLVGNLEDEGRYTGAENKEIEPEDQAKSPAEDASKDEKDEAQRSGQNKDALQTAQTSSSSATPSASASASAFASAFASPSPAPTGSASASETAKPARVRPGPAVTGEPEGDGGDTAAAAPARPPAPPARAPGGPGVQRNGAALVDATLLGNRIQSKVSSAVGAAR